jgi:hypothetical protein
MRCCAVAVLMCLVAWPQANAAELVLMSREAGDPVCVARDFYTAVVLQDREAVERLAVPTESAELDWLFKLNGPHPDYFEDIRRHYAKVSVVELKAGDVLKLPGREFVLQPWHFRPDRLVLHFEGQPVPTFVSKINGRWRIEPDICIEGCKEKVAAFPKEVEAAESAVRQFMMAVIFRDRELLKQHIIPFDRGELNWLTMGQAAPPELRDEYRKYFEALPIKRLEIGDIVDVPGAGPLVLDARHVNSTKMQLLPQDAPIPMIVIRTDEGWRVDPEPVIAGRKAAAAHRAQERLRK